MENYKYGARKLCDWLKADGRALSTSSFVDFIHDCFDAGVDYSVPNFARAYLALKEKLELNKQLITASYAVKFALEGYQRSAGLTKEVARKPILLADVELLTRSAMSVLQKALCVVGYVFLLRSSEVIELLAGHGTIARVAAGFRLYLPHSKGDPMCAGVSVLFQDLFVPLSLCHPLRQALALLLVSSSLACSAASLNQEIQKVLGGGLVFHCLRHGRATDLFNEGVSLAEIQRLGRWKTRAALVCYLH